MHYVESTMNMFEKLLHLYYSSGPEDDFESCLRNIKSQYEVFRSSSKSFKIPVYVLSLYHIKQIIGDPGFVCVEELLLFPSIYIAQIGQLTSP